MKTILVGGTFNESGGKMSGVVRKLGQIIDCTTIINGGNLFDIHTAISHVLGHDLVLWFPDFPNSARKAYPTKDKGAILICSKVMREGYQRLDSVSRIFKMHGNAVIEIYKEDKFRFVLVDALANEWANTTDLDELVKAIYKFCEWTKGSIRKGTLEIGKISDKERLEKLAGLTRIVADKVETNKNLRYFGNVSTRCEAMFPSLRIERGDVFCVSARNINKERITAEDFVLVNSFLGYFGERKPSVDTPIQVQLYKQLPGINYMIHGHAYIKDAEETEEYYPCGDMREVKESLDLMLKIVEHDKKKVINLKHHGFLMFAGTLKELEELVNSSTFTDVRRMVA